MGTWHIHRHKDTHPEAHTHTQKQAHRYTNICIHSIADWHTSIHTHRGLCTDTHIDTYIQSKPSDIEVK